MKNTLNQKLRIAIDILYTVNEPAVKNAMHSYAMTLLDAENNSVKSAKPVKTRGTRRRAYKTRFEDLIAPIMRMHWDGLSGEKIAAALGPRSISNFTVRKIIKNHAHKMPQSSFQQAA